MAFFDWEDRYSVGNPIIDQQHKQLVAMLNQVYDALKAGKARDVLEKVLKSLVQYTKTHFAHEETLMRRANYPDYAAHKEKHDKMTAKVQEIMTAFDKGELSNPLQVSTFLKNWLQKHILETDAAYSPYLQNMGK